MPSCEFCGKKVGKDDFEEIDDPETRIFVCGKSECVEACQERFEDAQAEEESLRNEQTE